MRGSGLSVVMEPDLDYIENWRHEELLFLQTLTTFGHDPLLMIENFLSIVKAKCDQLSRQSSATSYSMHAGELDVWKQEYRLWLLILMLVRHRLEAPHVEEDRDSVPSRKCNFSDRAVIGDLLRRDRQVKEFWIVQKWLERVYEPCASTIIECGELDLNGVRLPRDWKEPKGEVSDKVSSADVDLGYHVYELLRGGRARAAERLLIHSGQSARAGTLVMLLGDSLFCDEVMVKRDEKEDRELWLEVEEEYDGQVKSKRMLWPTGVIQRESLRHTSYVVAERLALENVTERNSYDMALYALNGGNVARVLPVCKSWEDVLWVHLKIVLDDCIQSELERVPLCWREVTDEYAAKGSMSDLDLGIPEVPYSSSFPVVLSKLPPWSEIFTRLHTCANPHVRKQVHRPLKMIAESFILGCVEDVLQRLCDLVLGTPKRFTTTSSISPLDQKIQSNDQFRPVVACVGVLRRFAVHLVLVLAILEPKLYESQRNQSNATTILGNYIDHLIAHDHKQLVADYCAHLPSPIIRQQHYAHFLQRMKDTAEREQGLGWAAKAGLDVSAIASMLVDDMIREVGPPSNNISSLKPRSRQILDVGAGEPTSSTLPQNAMQVSDSDMERIKALEWLALDNSQTQHSLCLLHANALARVFIRSHKVRACQVLFEWLNSRLDLTIWSDSQPPGPLHQVWHEFQSLQVYINALEAYTDWVEHEASKPRQFPDPGPIDHQNQRKRHHLHDQALIKWEKERWRLTGIVLQKLRCVLLFPGGWLSYTSPDNDTLHNTKDEDGKEHESQLLQLKLDCIPEITFLLHHVLHSTQNYSECLSLADLVASQGRSLYQYFSHTDLEKLLISIRSSSLQLLQQGYTDPLGYE